MCCTLCLCHLPAGRRRTGLCFLHHMSLLPVPMSHVQASDPGSWRGVASCLSSQTGENHALQASALFEVSLIFVAS